MKRPWKNLFFSLLAVWGTFWADFGRASSGSFQISGYVRDTLGNPLANLDITGDDYVGDLFRAQTLDDGSYIVLVDADGNYLITPDCEELTARGYACFPGQSVTVNDNAPTLNFIVEFANSPLQITNVFLPAGNVGMSCNMQFGAWGGHAPYTWQLAVDSDLLPAGLSFATNGLIFGTPLTNGVFTLKVQLTGADSSTVDKTFPLRINPRPVLVASGWNTGQFFMWISGGTNQNYTIQTSASLESDTWMTLLVTNHASAATFLINDPRATNASHFYRVLIGP